MFRRMAAATTAGLIGGALALTGTAHADTFPASGWDLRQYDAGWEPAALSEVVNSTTVDLTKPSGDIGTSIETTYLGLAVSNGDVVSVDYELSGGASFAAGAVRMFLYDDVNADTETDPPSLSVAADSDDGTLSFVIDFDGEVGTMGLTYDASNDSAGTVTFTNLTIAGETILFMAPPEVCQWDDQLEADSPTCVEPTTEPTEPGDDPKDNGTAGEELPATSGLTALQILPAAGLLLLAAGVIAVVLARRRRRAIAVD